MSSPTTSDSAIFSILQDLAKSYDDALSEREVLTQFCQLYQDERDFSLLPECEVLEQLMHLLKTHRLTEQWLVEGAKQREQLGHIHVTLMVIRLLLRDEQFQHLIMKGSNPPTPILARSLAYFIELHFSASGGRQASTTDMLKELTNIFQKISNCVKYRQRLVDHRVHELLIQLLWSHDLIPLQCSLCALINLCKTESVSVSVAALECAPPLLHIVSSYDTISRHLASDLLLLLSQHSKLKEQIRDSDSLPICLRILHGDDLHLLHRMVGVVERLAESSDYQEDLRLLGGIPLLLGILSKHVISEGQPRETQEKLVVLRAVCCSALTQLLLNDTNAQLIVQGNGMYLIATNILPLTFLHHQTNERLQQNLQRYALRALRYLFSMERNRRVFKKVFPPHLFEAFINVGHYTRDLSAYTQLVHTINILPESERAVMQANIEGIDQNKAPIFSIGGYAVLELLGSGAFGSVYKVRKQGSDVFLALKEIRSTNPALGHTFSERSSSLGRLLNEVNIVREQLRHPNVVRYYKCFQEGEHLYIVMELLEGTPLSEQIASLGEKGLKFSEDRLLKIFTQLVLALRYLHKEKKVTHRDLSPSNLMLGEADKLTITDFGLAKQKQREFSVMKSVVGTVPYWCPELVQNEPYNEKADVWAAGCILYQMATLKPPFYSTNLLALAKKIAEVDYVPIPEGVYSPLISELISKCLTADPLLRPDSVQLGSMLAGVFMTHMDSLGLSNETLERKLTKEKQRTIRHYHKAMRSERRYQQLLSSSSMEPSPSGLQARRKLSSTFTALQMKESMLSQQPSVSTASVNTERSSLAGDYEERGDTPPPEDPLQNSSGSSVFADQEMHYRFPSNWEQQPASPQVPRGSGRPNPLTSHTSASKDAPPPSISTSQLLTRRTSAVGGHLGWGAGPLSPLTSGHKSRTPSASSILSISPKHLREITDPILVLLTQLHKLIFLTQLPPSPTPLARWSLIQRYKRFLFNQDSSGVLLKTELHKLVNATAESVAGVGGEQEEGGGSHMVQRALEEMAEGGDMDYMEQDNLTYENLQQMIEGLVIEHGYYQTQANIKQHHS